MTTILIKKKDTAGAPAAGDLTNAAGGTEIAVNTATKRIYSKDSGGNVIELGTNPSGTTMAGNLLFSPDNTYDIGASGATRARTLYLGTSLITPSITNSGLTSGRVVYSSTGGLETDSANLTFDGTNLTMGAGSGTASLKVNGGNSGTAGGSNIVFGGAGSYAIGVGYSSSILGGAYDAAMLLYSGGGSLVLGSAADIIFSNNGRSSEYMRVTSGGNVGIGTSSPSYKLDVSGTINNNSGVVFYRQTNTGTSNNGLILGTTDKATASSGNQGAIQIWSNDASNQLQASVSLITSATAANRRLSIGVIEQGVSYRNVTIAEDGGNVGIGTTSPTAKLVVSGGGMAVQGNGNPTTGAGWEFYTDTTTASYAQSYSRTSSAWLDANWNALTHKFSTSGAERMRIDSSGNVGIGSSPAATSGRLQVYSPVNSASAYFSGNANAMSVLSQSGLTVYTNLSAGNTDTTLVAGNAAGTYMAFGIHNGTTYNERMRIDSSGNVGIGTSSPASKLDVITGTNSGIRVSDGTYTGTFVPSSLGGMAITTGGAYPLISYINGAERMRIDASGNLCLGTTSTLGAKFALYGSSGGTNNYIQITNPGYGTACVGVTASGSNVKFYNCYATGVLADGKGIDIDTNGFVGVNTSTPGQNNGGQFTVVSSTSNAGQFIVTTNSYPLVASQNGSTSGLIYFNYNAVNVGTITTNGTITIYNTTSDYRLKNITGNLTGYKERLMSLLPKQGTWKSNNSEFRGFLAHEFAVNYSASVTGEKDAVDDEGNPVMQGMQASSAEVMADLIALVQEQQAVITSLTARITALEST